MSFTSAIEAQFIRPTSTSLKQFYIVTKGIFPIRDPFNETRLISVKSRIDTPILWQQFPPRIYAYEPWINKDVSWHVYGDTSGLCWVHKEEWKLVNTHISKKYSPEQQRYFCAAWVNNSLESLLQRHFLGTHLGYDSWPPEWDECPHDERESTVINSRLRKLEKHLDANFLIPKK